MTSLTAARLSSTRPLLAAVGYVAAVVVLLAMAWSGIADILERRQSVAAATDLLAVQECRPIRPEPVKRDRPSAERDCQAGG